MILCKDIEEYEIEASELTGNDILLTRNLHETCGLTSVLRFADHRGGLNHDSVTSSMDCHVTDAQAGLMKSGL